MPSSTKQSVHSMPAWMQESVCVGYVGHQSFSSCLLHATGPLSHWWQLLTQTQTLRLQSGQQNCIGSYRKCIIYHTTMCVSMGILTPSLYYGKTWVYIWLWWETVAFHHYSGLATAWTLEGKLECVVGNVTLKWKHATVPFMAVQWYLTF